MAAVSFYETLVQIYQTSRSFIPKDNKFNIRRWQYIQSDITSDVRTLSRLEN